MSKFGTFREYPEDSLASAEMALLTAWRSLERYHEDLVFVGGLPDGRPAVSDWCPHGG